jgi:hypothetical protein
LTQFYRYGGVSLVALLVVNAGLWPWLTPSARTGILVAALVAYPIQMLAFFPPAPTLLGLAGFFFGLLLLEPLFLRPRGAETTEII